MQQIINYIIDNWMWLLPMILSVVEFFILLIFKKPEVIKFIDNYYDELIELVNEAEECLGSGQGKLKLDYVVAHFLQHHPHFTRYGIEIAVDHILSTPTKKGGK